MFNLRNSDVSLFLPHYFPMEKGKEKEAVEMSAHVVSGHFLFLSFQFHPPFDSRFL